MLISQLGFNGFIYKTFRYNNSKFTLDIVKYSSRLFSGAQTYLFARYVPHSCHKCISVKRVVWGNGSHR